MLLAGGGPPGAGGRAGHRRVTPRYRLLLVDQGLYAASNLAAVVLAGRSADPARFGRFMLAFLALSVAVNGVRAMWSEPEMARGEASPAPSRATAVVVAAASSTVAVAGMAGLAPWAAAVAAAGTVALLQDRLRYRALLRRHPAAAVRSDAVWVLVMAAVGAATVLSPAVASRLGVDDVLGVWTLGAGAAVAVNLPASQRRANVERPGRVAAPRGLFAADFVLQSGATQAVGLLLALVMAPAPYGELRGAITLLGPVGVANTALTTQLLAGRPARARLVAGIGGAALAVVAGLAAVPERVGTAALGSAWPGRAVLALIGATVAAQTVSTWGLTRLKLADRRRALLVLRAGGAVALAGASLGAAAASGGVGLVAAAYLAVNAALALAAGALARRTPAVAPVPPAPLVRTA
ncbi:MAG: hypothetical protein R2761_02285 [Acidimicrobiales bacterium]